MKFWVRIIACFLIAWLPMLGYPAQAVMCPKMATTPVVQHQVEVGNSSESTGCMTAAKHHAASVQLPACHGNMGSVVCGMPAILVSHLIVFVPAAPVYRAITPTFGEQFIPQLPEPPPRSL